jgi:hypothetical protein
MTKEKETNFIELASELLSMPKKHLKNLLELGLINSTSVNMFLVLNLYPKYKEGRSKKDTIQLVADEANLSDSYVRSVISNYPQYILQFKFANCWERLQPEIGAEKQPETTEHSVAEQPETGNTALS